jgi:hypothetical protein
MKDIADIMRSKPWNISKRFWEYLKPMVVIFLCLVFSGVSLQYIKAPFVWIFLLWSLAMIYFTITSKNRIAKFFFLNAGVALITLGFFEGYLFLEAQNTEPSPRRKDFSVRFFNDNDLLGYAYPGDTTVTVTDWHGDELLYEAVYTTADHGFRITPPYRGDTGECVLFFGGSYTFGLGVNDDEAMPYQVGMGLNGKYQIYNFGVGGYGPHQMLSMLEHGIVEDIIDCTPKYAVYQFSADHVERSAGLVSWDLHGPEYVLSKDGNVRFTGNFDDDKTKVQRNKSLIYRNIWGSNRKTNDKDVDLFIAIVVRSRELIETLYPGCEFHVINWDTKFSMITRGLVAQGIRVHYIRDIIPDLDENREKYQISPPNQSHPNPRAHELIAGYVVSEIVGEK